MSRANRFAEAKLRPTIGPTCPPADSQERANALAARPGPAIPSAAPRTFPPSTKIKSTRPFEVQRGVRRLTVGDQASTLVLALALRECYGRRLRKRRFWEC